MACLDEQVVLLEEGKCQPLQTNSIEEDSITTNDHTNSITTASTDDQSSYDSEPRQLSHDAVLAASSLKDFEKLWNSTQHLNQESAEDSLSLPLSTDKVIKFNKWFNKCKKDHVMNQNDQDTYKDCQERIKHQIEAKTAYFENTAVHIAAWYNDEGILSSILKALAGNDTRLRVLQEKNVNGDSPVHLAAEKGNVRILEVMHSFHKDCFHSNPGRFHWSPLHTACAYGQLEAVKRMVLLSSINTGKVDTAMLNEGFVKPDKKCKQQLPGVDFNTKGMVVLLPLILALTGFIEKPQPSLQEMIAPKIDKKKEHKKSCGTPLTLACMFGHADIVWFLLSVGYRSTKQKKEAFIAALENNHEECVKHIVVHSDQGELHDFLITDKEAGSRLYSNNNLDIKVARFNRIIQIMPNVAKCLLDKCVEFGADDFITIKYDFIHPMVQSSCDDIMLQTYLYKEISPLQTMIKTANVELLKHPVVVRFLNQRWNSRYGVANFLYWLVYFLYLVFMTCILIWVLPNPTDTALCAIILAADNEAHKINGSTHSMKLPISSVILLNMMAALMLLYSSVRLFFSEFYQFYTALQFLSRNTRGQSYWLKIAKFSYIWDYSNWLEIPLFILSIVFAIIILSANSKSFCLSDIEWQVGIIITCLSWIELILISRQFKLVGVQAQTFCRVFTTLIKFAPFAVFLFAAFGISFYLLFHESMIADQVHTGVGSPSSSPFYSMLLIYAMIGGYVDLDSVFTLPHGTSSDDHFHILPHLYYEVGIFLFWAMLLFFITLILTNTMIGLAVEDINDIYKAADFKRLELQVHHMIQTEAYKSWSSFRIVTSLIGKSFSASNDTKYHYQAKTVSLVRKLRKQVVFFLWGGKESDFENALHEVKQRQKQWP